MCLNRTHFFHFLPPHYLPLFTVWHASDNFHDTQTLYLFRISFTQLSSKQSVHWKEILAAFQKHWKVPLFEIEVVPISIELLEFVEHSSSIRLLPSTVERLMCVELKLCTAPRNWMVFPCHIWILAKLCIRSTANWMRKESSSTAMTIPLHYNALAAVQVLAYKSGTTTLIGQYRKIGAMKSKMLFCYKKGNVKPLLSRPSWVRGTHPYHALFPTHYWKHGNHKWMEEPLCMWWALFASIDISTLFLWNAIWSWSISLGLTKMAEYCIVRDPFFETSRVQLIQVNAFVKLVIITPVISICLTSWTYACSSLSSWWVNWSFLFAWRGHATTGRLIRIKSRDFYCNCHFLFEAIAVRCGTVTSRPAPRNYRFKLAQEVAFLRRLFWLLYCSQGYNFERILS